MTTNDLNNRLNVEKCNRIIILKLYLIAHIEIGHLLWEKQNCLEMDEKSQIAAQNLSIIRSDKNDPKKKTQINKSVSLC